MCKASPIAEPQHAAAFETQQQEGGKQLNTPSSDLFRLSFFIALFFLMMISPFPGIGSSSTNKNGKGEKRTSRNNR